jgi:hypothetical protein
VAEGRKPYRFERAARADLRQGVFWYEKEREGLGARFATEVQRAIDLILLAPLRWPVRQGAHRILVGTRLARRSGSEEIGTDPTDLKRANLVPTNLRCSGTPEDESYRCDCV